MSSIEQLDNQQCRTCYNSKINLQSLKGVPDPCWPSQAEQKSYGQLLTEVCNINIMLDIPPGNWPQFICLACSQKLKSAYDFIQQTHKINKYLKSIADHVQIKHEINFIEKPELDIPLEIKIETENDVDMSANETKFQYIPIKTEAIKEETILPTDDDECEDIPSNSFIVTEYPNEISEDDTEHSKLVNSPDITKSNSSATTLVCNECKKLFTSVSKLNRHKRFTHVPDEEKHPCHLCNLKFSRTYHFKRHVQTVHSRDNFQPEVVDNNKPTLASEIDTTATCHECNKIFYNPKKLARHKRLVHVPEEKKFTCNVCGNKFGRSDHLRRHMRTLHNPEAILPTKREIKVNKIVKKDNPTLAIEIAMAITCQECNKMFYNPKKLARHKRLVHVPEEKKFTCNVCGNKFGRSDHFRRHMRNLHNTEAILPTKREIKVKDNRFACDKCDRSYTRRCRLYKHEREEHSQ